ncbi:hypothetical protein BDN70DRAFT_874773 [Pholiota conissans]|uniref:Uncharacterized protein n=1 Tax=Pholiota conissans TaxID=109636 RepID=A0A9P6CW70_9AGAR|nr:hypothetical protein BDN70DRAFT_874773 [Pholiota conissans]
MFIVSSVVFNPDTDETLPYYVVISIPSMTVHTESIFLTRPCITMMRRTTDGLETPTGDQVNLPHKA